MYNNQLVQNLGLHNILFFCGMEITRSEFTASNGSNNGLNNSKQLKKCGGCKQYTTHNRHTCKVDLSAQ